MLLDCSVVEFECCLSHILIYLDRWLIVKKNKEMKENVVYCGLNSCVNKQLIYILWRAVGTTVFVTK